MIIQSSLRCALQIVAGLAILFALAVPVTYADELSNAESQDLSWIVGVRSDWSWFQSTDDLISQNIDGVVRRLNSNPSALVVNFDDDSAQARGVARLLEHPGIEYLEPDYIYDYMEEDPSPYFVDQAWARTVNLPQAWDIATGREDVVVAVLDSGVRADHPDLQGRLKSGYNFLDNTVNTEDSVGHGTAVAGIIAGSGGQGDGILGAAMDVRILPVRVGDANGAPVSKIADGIYFALDQGASVINISLGSDKLSATLENAINHAYEQDVVVVAASGNSTYAASFPATHHQTISVGATTLDGQRVATFSSLISRVDLAAPGVNVMAPFWSPATGNTRQQVSGTSYSAPIVSGTVALMLSVSPDLSVEEVRSMLRETTYTDLITGSNGVGAGLLDSWGALNQTITPDFGSTWLPADDPVSHGSSNRTWMWGPNAFNITGEDYDEGQRGRRVVAYFDKTRMEITNPYGDRDSQWHVTNGLLVNELISGQMQVGDQRFIGRGSAEVPVAGDQADVAGPTYSTFADLLDAEPHTEDDTITATVNREGSVGSDSVFSQYGVTAEYFVPQTDHQIASVFWEYLNSSATLRQQGSDVTGRLFDPVFYATGLPVTEAYWSRVTVAGRQTDVLIQCFERRCLTYTPENEVGWRVEMGNVGRHYHIWRYGSAPSTPALWDPAAFATEYLR